MLKLLGALLSADKNELRVRKQHLITTRERCRSGRERGGSGSSESNVVLSPFGRASRLIAVAFLSGALPAVPQSVPAASGPGAITGTVLDKTGASIAGAKVTLSHDANTTGVEVLCGNDGQFSFPNVAPGPYTLTVSAPGFATETSPGTLQAGETASLPPLTLNLAVVTSDIVVTMTKVELAEQQIKQQEQQRLIGIFPNFYVSYLPDALPLTTKQKFELAWKSIVDPVTFVVTGGVAGVQQARNEYSGFGQGFEGYAKRYGAAYGDSFTSTMIGGVILPSIFRQDPRYFYKGAGSTKSRLYYAISRAVISKGDNGEWQPNYSGIIGSLASGAISNFYYPEKNRSGVALTFENTLIDIGADALGNVAQEFLFKKLTPKAPHSAPVKN